MINMNNYLKFTHFLKSIEPYNIITKNLRNVGRFFYDLLGGGIISIRSNPSQTMDIDEDLITQHLARLNNGSDGVWSRADGFFALTSVEVNPKGVTFNPSRGLLIVTFIQQTTGAIKMFPLTMFQRR